MFIGHFGVGFGAKAYAPQVSLGTLFLANQVLSESREDQEDPPSKTSYSLRIVP